MQPDPTPDLDEIEKRHEYATSALEAVCKRDWKMRVSVPAKPNHDDDLVISASLQDIPWLLRAARERDELRAERDRAVARATSRKLKNQSHAEWRKLCARVGTARATIKKRERRIIALAALRDELRARAEKAEARVKELEAALTSVEWGEVDLGDDGMCPCCGNTKDVGHLVECCVGAALAQKEPR